MDHASAEKLWAEWVPVLKQDKTPDSSLEEFPQVSWHLEDAMAKQA